MVPYSELKLDLIRGFCSFVFFGLKKATINKIEINTTARAPIVATTAISKTKKQNTY